MHRIGRILAVACVLVLAGSITVGAQEATAEPELVVAGIDHGVDMALDPDGHRHIVSSDLFDARTRPVGDLWYATDRGGAWWTRKLLEGDGWDLAWHHPAIAVDSDGSVHIAVVRAGAGFDPEVTEGIYYLTDEGRDPGDFGPPVKVAGKDMTDPSLAVVDGVRYLVYDKYARLGDLSSPAPAILKTDHSGSWVEHRLARDGWDALVRTDPSGRAHIVFQSVSADGGGSVMRYVQVDPDTGEPTKSMRIPGTRDVWSSSSLAVDPSGQPHVAWETEKDIVWSRLTEDGWSRPEELGVRPSDSISLDIDASGQPHVVFVGRGDDGRGIIHAQRDAGAWPQSVIAGGRDWSRVSSALDGSDLVIAALAGEGREGLWSLGPLSAIVTAATGADTALDDLLASVTYSGCVPFTQQGKHDPFAYGAEAAIRCDRPARGVGQLALFRFPDADSMADYWEWRVGQIEPAPPMRDGACTDGRKGQATWPHGELVCYRSTAPKEAKLRWIDERTNTYGVLDATNQDIARLHAVWTKLTDQVRAR